MDVTYFIGLQKKLDRFDHIRRFGNKFCSSTDSSHVVSNKAWSGCDLVSVCIE